MLGEIYCVNPIVDRGSTFAPWVNKYSGILVTTPEKISNGHSWGDRPKEPVPLNCLMIRYCVCLLCSYSLYKNGRSYLPLNPQNLMQKTKRKLLTRHQGPSLFCKACYSQTRVYLPIGITGPVSSIRKEGTKLVL